MPEIIFGYIRCIVSCTVALTTMPELKVNDKITAISITTPTPVPPFESTMNAFFSPSLEERKNVEDGNSSEMNRTCHCPTWTLRNRHWVYRGEGNASIVLALPQERMIVRLAKIDNKLRRMDSDNQFILENVNGGIRTISETLERIVFSQSILGQLLGSGLVRPCHVYHIDLDEIEQISQVLDKIRPAHRKHKRLAPVCHALVYSDCTLLDPAGHRAFAAASQLDHHQPVFCVELKPKQGFLSRDHQHCPFCLNQFLKKKHGKIQVLSQYCPLDLFSGFRPRMLKAVAALTRTPQNNLRIFQDGNLVFAEECQSDLLNVLQKWFQLEDTPTDRTRPLRCFCALLIEALTARLPEHGRHSRSSSGSVDPPGVVEWTEWTEDERDYYAPCLAAAAAAAQSSSSILPSSRSVLSQTLLLQSLGDVDFERLYDAYDGLVDRFLNGSLSFDRMRWKHPSMTADWLTKDQDLGEFNAEEESIRLVQRYRISSTARDCSIMIAFQRMMEEEESVDDDDDELVVGVGRLLFRCRVSVVDLDPKPVSCVDKHRRRNAAMNEAFLESLINAQTLNGRNCSGGGSVVGGC